MLVLSRKKGEAIVIGDNIELTVIGVEGDTVKLGIVAPKEVEVYRKELYLSIQQYNKEASNQALKLDGLKELLQRHKK
jgi:carbon storage regulator